MYDPYGGVSPARDWLADVGPLIGGEITCVAPRGHDLEPMTCGVAARHTEIDHEVVAISYNCI